ncbi:alpha-2-macroglobulin-like isoform X3 [Scyliorhinus canicula]|uniref:alpha-2-macroglobulin-like isoform X3 n=1 Tax=Scyliorhinus canicula TaxID=7830 RepID=UPI0018F748B5|nr:alpha-2-macroglobulin-like isoform X3 [Scyliorhinus canicula]
MLNALQSVWRRSHPQCCLAASSEDADSATVKEWPIIFPDQNVLPQYEITLEFPEIITFLQEKIQVKVCARYINGYPVSGFVNGKIMFKINDLFEHFLVAGNLSNGCSKMEILIQPFNLYSRKCAAFFEITDAGTGNLLEKSAECKIVKKITKMAFEDVEQYYKTGIPYRGQIRMQYSTGGPVSNVTIYLFNSMVPGAEKVITDENGIASFSLDTSSWGSESVSLSAMYQFNNKDLWRPLPIHGKARHTAKLFYSRSNSYFSISKHRQELVCDSELDVNVDYIIKALSAQEKHDLDVFYLVMSRGLIVTLKKKTISVGGSEGTKGHLRLSLLINADISPVARLLVFTVLPDGETIGDSAKFQVSKCFRNKVSLHFSVAEDLPKSHVSLDVHAAPDSLCGLRVVDRSVPTPQT